MIWISSDLHLGHDREFIWKARGFNSCDEMNEAIIERFNSCIAPDDDLYLLGDLMLGDNEKGIELLSRLNGRLHVVWGNHCTDRRKQLYRTLHSLVEDGHVLTIKHGKYHFYCSHFPTLTGNLERESLKQMTLNLYGHTHQKSLFYEDRPYMFHVGVDSHDCYPWNLEEIPFIMEAKVYECLEYL